MSGIIIMIDSHEVIAYCQLMCNIMSGIIDADWSVLLISEIITWFIAMNHYFDANCTVSIGSGIMIMIYSNDAHWPVKTMIGLITWFWVYYKSQWWCQLDSKVEIFLLSMGKCCFQLQTKLIILVVLQTASNNKNNFIYHKMERDIDLPKLLKSLEG